MYRMLGAIGLLGAIAFGYVVLDQFLSLSNAADSEGGVLALFFTRFPLLILVLLVIAMVAVIVAISRAYRRW